MNDRITFRLWLSDLLESVQILLRLLTITVALSGATKLLLYYYPINSITVIQTNFNHLIHTVFTHYCFTVSQYGSFHLLCFISASNLCQYENEAAAVSGQDGLEGDPSPPECWRRLKSRGSLKQSENLYTTSDKSWIWEVLTIQQLQSRHVKPPAEKNNSPIVLAPHSIVVCGQSHPSGGAKTNFKKNH